MAVSSNTLVGSEGEFPLIPGRSYRFGRQPDSEIRLANHYSMVSRYHAIVEPSPNEEGWQVRDLASANGTFVNQQRLTVTHLLRSGDQIQLGQTGPQFTFAMTPETGTEELPSLLASHFPPKSPTGAVTLTQLFPLISTGNQLGDNPIFLLGILTIGIGVSLFVGFGNPLLFNGLLALYLSLSLYYIFIYQKNWV